MSHNLKRRFVKWMIKSFSKGKRTPACPYCGYSARKEDESYEEWICGDCGTRFLDADIKDWWIGTGNMQIAKLCFALGYDNQYLEQSGCICEHHKTAQLG